MLIVGLTGGIATGKSTVTKLLRKHSVTVLDCDEIAHAIVIKGRWGYRRVIKAFGQEILTPAGDIDRDKLGHKIFNDPMLRRKLNSATHVPVALELIKQVFLQWLGLTSVVVVDMPLLFETGAYRLTWPTVFVTCDHKTEAEAKVKAQMPLNTKQAKAHIVIDNSKDLEHMEGQVQNLVSSLQQYRWLGMLTSPVMLVGIMWLVIQGLRR